VTVKKNHELHDQRCFEEEIRKLPYLEVWLNEFTTIHAGIKISGTTNKFSDHNSDIVMILGMQTGLHIE